MSNAHTPYTLVRALEHSLAESMVLRANGTLHMRGCLNAQVNSTWYPCSPNCVEAQNTLKSARAWLAEHIPSVPKLRAPTRPLSTMEVFRQLHVGEKPRIDAQKL